MCPPPQVFQGEHTAAHVVWRAADGTVEQRRATFIPLGSSAGDTHTVVTVLSESRNVDVPVSSGIESRSSQELHERLQQLARQQRRRYRFDRLVGDSLAMRRVREQVRVAIVGRPRVVIIGPPGSGREHAARTIHAGDNPEKAGPLLPLACAGVDGEAVQTAVLDFLRRSHEHGGGSAGTILLQEVDSLAADAQAELQAFFRVPTFSARTIATAQRSLLQLAGEGSFLPELAYVLSSLVIELPALRDRPEDIPLLAQRFVEDYNAAAGKQLAGFSPAALDRLAALPWTGNVEELAAVVGEACRHVGTVWIGEADLPPRVKAIVSAGSHPRRAVEHIKLDEFLVEIERELIQQAMQRARGNKAKAARMLGVSRPRLLRRLVQLGLEVPQAPEIDFKLVEDDSVQPGSEVAE
jgi:DNA-binding NtrC family response regulator